MASCAYSAVIGAGEDAAREGFVCETTHGSCVRGGGLGARAALSRLRREVRAKAVGIEAIERRSEGDQRAIKSSDPERRPERHPERRSPAS